MQKVAAILLSAGQSSRMGAFKPLLPFGDKTVIDACIDYLQHGGAEHTVVVLGHRAAELREHLRHRSVTFALNPDPTSEMAASITAGVRALPDSVSCALIALVDHPAVPSHVVTALVQEWSQGARLVIPTWEGRGGHPVLVDVAFREQLCNLDPREGLRALFRQNRDSVSRIPVDSPFIARDMDTWDDYRALYEEVFGGPPPVRQI